MSNRERDDSHIHLLERMAQHYLNPETLWMFGRDVYRGMAEFVGDPTRELPFEALDYFIDWFIFDFDFAGEQTPIVRYRELNPHSLPKEELALADAMARSHMFDFWQICGVAERGIDVTSVRTNHRYTIAEKAEEKMGIGDVMLSRIVQVRGEWRIASLDTLGLAHPSRRDLARMREVSPLDPRFIYHEIISPTVAAQKGGT